MAFRPGGSHDSLQFRPPPFERPFADIFAVVFQQIERQQHHRRLSENLGAEFLAPDAPLHLREWQRSAIFPRQHFAIEHRAFGQQRACRRQFGKPIRNQLFAARPKECPPLTPDQLRADSVPLPFDLPVVHITQALDFALERIRQAERVGPAHICIGRLLGQDLRGEIRRWLPIAHQPVGQHVRVDTARLRQRAHDEALRNANAKFSRDQLVPNEALAIAHGVPGLDHRIKARAVVPVAHGQQALLHPVTQRPIACCVGGGQQQRDGLGEIPDSLIGFAEKPL